jgi:hypothetical protein
MTSDEFVDRIRKAVYDSAVEDSLSLLQHPPGRRPSSTLLELSRWFNQLPNSDQERIHATVQLAVGQAVFGMLTVLDGDRSIRQLGETGLLQLLYTQDNRSVLLNDPHREALHDLFAKQVPPT